jgi:UDP-N-acetylglucosamine 2-epimerase (non-hydrolysing)
LIKALLVAGARPNFVKIAPLIEEIQKRKSEVEAVLVHTGQHFDRSMSQSFFEDLGIPEPGVNLEVGGGSHSQQTAMIMKRFEPVKNSTASLRISCRIFCSLPRRAASKTWRRRA